MQSRLLPFALLWILLDFVNASQVNVTVDDANPLITYTGNNWTAVDNCGECGARLDISRVEGGSYHMAHQTDSKAEFSFTGVSVSVYGVTIPHWRGPAPNVSFTIDGTEKAMDITNTSGNRGLQYNTTLFQADNLPNVPHTLSIQTHGDSLFILDYLTYATNASVVTTASNGTDSTESAPASSSTFPYDQSASSPSSTFPYDQSASSPSSTFPYDQSASSPSTGTQPAVLGGVIGGIFGAFLIAGIIGLWFIRRANRRRRDFSKVSWNKNKHQRSPMGRKSMSLRERRGKSNKIDSGSSFGGPPDQSKRGESDGDGRGEEKRRAGIPVEYAFSDPKSKPAPVPLMTTPKLEALSEAANNGGGRYLSAISTFTSSTSGGEEGKERAVHALTTDTPQQAHPLPLHGASQWPSAKRPNTANAATPVYGSSQWPNTKRTDMMGAARPFSSGSTLEVDGVLERVMLNHSNIPGHTSREEEPPAVFFSDHPFRSVGSG